MTSVSETESSIEGILFSGERTDWPMWKVKFLARSNRKGFKTLLTSDTAIPEAVGESGLSDDQKKLVKKAELAFEELILSIKTDKASGKSVFHLLQTSVSDAMPA